MSFNKDQFHTSGSSFKVGANQNLLNAIKDKALKINKHSFVNTNIQKFNKETIELELTEEEIEQYKKEGYIVEEFQEGGETDEDINIPGEHVLFPNQPTGPGFKRTITRMPAPPAAEEQNPAPIGLTKQVPKTQWKQLPDGTWYQDVKAGNKGKVESTGRDVGGRKLQKGGETDPPPNGTMGDFPPGILGEANSEGYSPYSPPGYNLRKGVSYQEDPENWEFWKKNNKVYRKDLSSADYTSLRPPTKDDLKFLENFSIWANSNESDSEEVQQRYNKEVRPLLKSLDRPIKPANNPKDADIKQMIDDGTFCDDCSYRYSAYDIFDFKKMPVPEDYSEAKSKPEYRYHRERNPFTHQDEPMSPTQHKMLQREAYKLQNQGITPTADNMPVIENRELLDVLTRKNVGTRPWSGSIGFGRNEEDIINEENKKTSKFQNHQELLDKINKESNKPFRKLKNGGTMGDPPPKKKLKPTKSSMDDIGKYREDYTQPSDRLGNDNPLLNIPTEDTSDKFFTTPFEQLYKTKAQERKKHITEKSTDVVNYYNQYMKSPRYKKMLGPNPDIAKQRRINLGVELNQIPKLTVATVQPEDRQSTGGYSTTATGDITVLPYGYDVKGILPHEWSHSMDRPENPDSERAIPKKDIDYINKITPTDSKILELPKLSNVKSEGFTFNELQEEFPEFLEQEINWKNYVSEPTEVRARLNDIRYQSKKRNLYDPFTQKVTPDIFQKILNTKFETGDKENFDALKQLKGIYTDEQILYMLNDISQKENSQNEELNIAQKGGEKISKTGYKSNSPDKNEPSLIVPSSNITMKGVTHPVFGIDNLGNKKLMFPNNNYTFPGSYVKEIPIKQKGGEVLELTDKEIKKYKKQGYQIEYLD